MTEAEFFHWLSPVFCLTGFNVLKYVLANASYVVLGWVNEAARGLVYEVVLVIF